MHVQFRLFGKNECFQYEQPLVCLMGLYNSYRFSFYDVCIDICKANFMLFFTLQLTEGYIRLVLSSLWAKAFQ
ncbi:Uncharacterised protein [Raoultella planticola]|nr:Uncharacterised protein [Raoultella planticola]